MKRRDLIRHLIDQGCELVREGGIILGGAILVMDIVQPFQGTMKYLNI